MAMQLTDSAGDRQYATIPGPAERRLGRARALVASRGLLESPPSWEPRLKLLRLNTFRAITLFGGEPHLAILVQVSRELQKGLPVGV